MHREIRSRICAMTNDYHSASGTMLIQVLGAFFFHMLLWLHVLVLLDFFKVCENQFRRELLMSPLPCVEEVAVASPLDDGSHDVLVPREVVDRHEFEVGDRVVFGVQDESRNAYIGNHSIATGLPVELMATFESTDAASD